MNEYSHKCVDIFQGKNLFSSIATKTIAHIA